MKKQILILKSTALLAISIGFYACDPNKESAKPVSGSVYVVCEGNLNAANGTISVYNVSTNETEINPYKNRNGVGLGDNVQSMSLIGEKAYIVVNNSNKIEIADANTFESKGVITGLKQPRYFVKVTDSKAYVSEYISYRENGRISVIDLATNTVTKTIALGYLPENLFLNDNKIYVSNNGGNTVNVINTSTDTIENTITVTSAPSGFVKDANDKIWVLCSGIKTYNSDYSLDLANSEAGALVRFDPSNFAVEQTISFSSIPESPSRLTINKEANILYYLNGGVYSFDINATAISTTPFIARSFYGLGFDPKNGTIYTGTYGFVSNQKLIRYNANGIALDSAEVGIGPNGFVFR